MVWERRVVRVIVQGEKNNDKKNKKRRTKQRNHSLHQSSVRGDLNVYPSLLFAIGRMIV